MDQTTAVTQEKLKSFEEIVQQNNFSTINLKWCWHLLGLPWHLHLRQVLCHASVALDSALGRELIGFLVGLFLEEAALVVIPRWVTHGCVHSGTVRTVS